MQIGIDIIDGFPLASMMAFHGLYEGFQSINECLSLLVCIEVKGIETVHCRFVEGGQLGITEEGFKLLINPLNC